MTDVKHAEKEYAEAVAHINELARIAPGHLRAGLDAAKKHLGRSMDLIRKRAEKLIKPGTTDKRKS